MLGLLVPGVGMGAGGGQIPAPYMLLIWGMMSWLIVVMGVLEWQLAE